ncbi:hypothetical protein [Pseudoscardovia suis]|uniref:hypothetical protein n=1 Tax=Pseudoscardovia suis TaxID=987063 RepID=UPI003F9D0BA3
MAPIFGLEQFTVTCKRRCETLKNFNFGSGSMKYIERPEYVQRPLDLMGTPDIKIITGVRRRGMSRIRGLWL